MHVENNCVENDFFVNQRGGIASKLYYRETPTCSIDRGTTANISRTSDIKPIVNIEQLVNTTRSNDNKYLELSGTVAKPGDDQTEDDEDEFCYETEYKHAEYRSETGYEQTEYMYRTGYLQNDIYRTEYEQDRYVYRILRIRETYTWGLRPKNISSNISIEEHVAEGSKGIESQYISCCKTLNGIRKLGGITNKSNLVRAVVKINITKLRKLRGEIQIVDLTDTRIRRKHIRPNSKAWGYAEKFEEVIICPTSHIPPEYVKYIGKIHRRRFIQINHV